MSLRKKLLDTFGAQVSSDHERYPADVKCLGFLYLYVGRYPRNNASRNTLPGFSNTPARMAVASGRSTSIKTARPPYAVAMASSTQPIPAPRPMWKTSTARRVIR